MLKSNISSLINYYSLQIISLHSMHLKFSQLIFESKWKLIESSKLSIHLLHTSYHHRWDWFQKSTTNENEFMIYHISKQNASSSQSTHIYSKNETISNTLSSMRLYKLLFNKIEKLYWWKKISQRHFDTCRWLRSIDDF